MDAFLLDIDEGMEVASSIDCDSGFERQRPERSKWIPISPGAGDSSHETVLLPLHPVFNQDGNQ
jgi:hypothetical protein